MPGRYETHTPAPAQTLNGAGAAGKTTPAEVEGVLSPGHWIALVAVLVSACALVLGPAVVAGISMIDPSSLDQTASWFRPLSPITSQLDHARLLLAAGSVITVWSGRQGNELDGSGA